MRAVRLPRQAARPRRRAGVQPASELPHQQIWHHGASEHPDDRSQQHLNARCYPIRSERFRRNALRRGVWGPNDMQLAWPRNDAGGSVGNRGHGDRRLACAQRDSGYPDAAFGHRTRGRGREARRRLDARDPAGQTRRRRRSSARSRGWILAVRAGGAAWLGGIRTKEPAAMQAPAARTAGPSATHPFMPRHGNVLASPVEWACRGSGRAGASTDARSAICLPAVKSGPRSIAISPIRRRASCPRTRGSGSGWSGPCTAGRTAGQAGPAAPPSASGVRGPSPAPRRGGPRRW